MSEVIPANDKIEKPEKKPRLLKTNNEWNVEGLLNIRTDKDGEIVVCDKTEAELYYINEAGSKIMLDSFGNCAACKKTYHHSYIKFGDSHAKPTWPVEYTGGGCYCLDCHKLPLTMEEQEQIRDMMRR